MEACLFAFKEIAESVGTKESYYIPLFMSQLQNVPFRHIKIISATMEAIGINFKYLLFKIYLTHYSLILKYYLS